MKTFTFPEIFPEAFTPQAFGLELPTPRRTIATKSKSVPFNGPPTENFRSSD